MTAFCGTMVIDTETGRHRANGPPPAPERLVRMQGKPNDGRRNNGREPIPVEDRLWHRVEEQPNGCWLWTGGTVKGYGKVSVRYRKLLTHRLAYELVVGQVPAGLELDHLCRDRLCMNPAHLEAVTHLENMRRSAPATKTHCINGHLLDEANTYLRPRGGRDCRKCTAQRQREYQARQRLVA